MRSPNWHKRCGIAARASANSFGHSFCVRKQSGTLLHFRCKARSVPLAHHRPAGRQRTGARLSTSFDGTNNWSILDSTRVGHGNEPLLRTQAVNHCPLAAPEDCHGQNWEMPEHPEKVQALPKRRHEITGPDRSLHLDHTLGEFFDPHYRFT